METTSMMLFAYITLAIVVILLLNFFIFSFISLRSDKPKYENIANISGFLAIGICLVYVIICCYIY
jgi:hypothetical protein